MLRMRGLPCTSFGIGRAATIAEDEPLVEADPLLELELELDDDVEIVDDIVNRNISKAGEQKEKIGTK